MRLRRIKAKLWPTSNNKSFILFKREVVFDIEVSSSLRDYCKVFYDKPNFDNINAQFGKYVRQTGKSIFGWEIAAGRVWSKNLRDRHNRRMLRLYVRRLRSMGLSELAKLWAARVRDW